MGNCVFERFKGENISASFELICRSEVDLLEWKDDIEKEINHLCTLTFTKEDIEYLDSFRLFSRDYLKFLSTLKLKRSNVNVYEQDGKLQIKISGNWKEITYFEIPILSILNEVYFEREFGLSMVEELELCHKTVDGLSFIKKEAKEIKFSDYGTRRRASFRHHEAILRAILTNCPENFTGTSNVFFAKKFSLRAVGTMAHEYIQAFQVLRQNPIQYFQDEAFSMWSSVYPEQYHIALTDTINSRQLIEFSTQLLDFSGFRHDSGDPIEWCDFLIQELKKSKIDPMTKTAIFSDSITFEKASEIYEKFHGQIKIVFGIGTHLTCNIGKKNPQMVIKLSEINGQPVAKISDEPSKEFCKDPKFLKELKEIFNISNHAL
jgi:nicotinate phosphoribosyltransferase